MSEIKFCVSMSTIPSRIKSVHKTLDIIKKQTKQPEKIFLNIPLEYKRFKNEKINDAAANISNIALIVTVLFLFICFLPNNVRNLKLIFLFTTLAVVGYIIRVVAFAVTVPPPPVQQHEDEYDNILDKIMKEGDPRAAVSDFMFSGHAFFIVLSMLFIWNYRKISDTFYLSPELFYMIYGVLVILGLITLPAISLSRLHYSSDVVIGTSIAVLLFLARNHFALKLDYQELL